MQRFPALAFLGLALCGLFSAPLVLAQPAPLPDFHQLMTEAKPHVEKRQWAVARPLLEQAESLDRDNPQLLSWLGQAQAATRSGKAAGTLRRALEKNGADVPVARALAKILERKDPKSAARVWLIVAREAKDRDAALRAGRLAVADPETCYEGYRLAAGGTALLAADTSRYALAAVATKRVKEAKDLLETAIAANPTDLSLQITSARLAISQKEFPAAAALLTAVLEKNPKEIDAILAQAEMANAQGDPVAEEKYLTALVAQKPDHPTGHKRLALLLTSKPDWPAAKAAWEAHLRVEKADVDAHRALGEAAWRAGQHSEAAEHAQAILQVLPRDAAASLLLGQARFLTHDLAGAVAPLTAGLAATEEAAPRAMLGASLHAQGQDARAKPVLQEALKRQAKEPLASEILGEIALANRRPEEAGRLFSTAAELPPRATNPDFLVRAARAWIAAKQWSNADDLMQRALKVDPAHTGANATRAYVLLAKARLAKEGGETGLPAEVTELARDAAAILEALPDSAVKSADIQADLAQARLLAGDNHRAAEAARQALALKATQPLAAEVLALTQPRGDPARLKLLQAAAASPTVSSQALQELGHAHLENKDIPAARKAAAGIRGGSRVATEGLKARIEYADGNYRAAESLILPLLAADAVPVPAEFLLLGADIAYERGDFPRALERFKRSSAAPDARGHARMCELLAKAGDYAGAIIEGERALQGGIDTPALHANLGYALFKSGQKAESKKQLELATAKGATDKTTNLILGEIAASEGRAVEALGYLKTVLAVDTGNAAAHLLMGQLLVKQARYEEAVPHLEKVFGANKHAEAGAALARAYLSVDNVAKAQRVMTAMPANALPPEVDLLLKGRVQAALGNHKKANDYFEKALAAKPGDGETLFFQGLNYLKLPHYERAIALLEQAHKADPLRPEVAGELARLYAETGQREKAGQALATAEKLEAQAVEERRKAVPPAEIKTIAVSPFKNSTGDKEHAWLSLAIADALTSRLAKSARIRVVERNQLQKVREERVKELLRNEAALDEHSAAEFGKDVAASAVLVGSYAVVNDGLQINARMVDMATGKVGRSASRAGPLADLAKLEAAVALELLGQYVALTEDERAAVKRESGENVESMRLLTAARQLERQGDLRGAQALYRDAVAADEGNAWALVGLAQNLQTLGTKNRIAVLEFKKLSKEGPDWYSEGLLENLSAKLAQVQGVQVVERTQLEAVKKEMAFATDEDNVDQSDLPQFGKQLAAGCVLTGSWQVYGGQLRLTARLIDLESSKDLLGDTVSGDEKQLFELADELAEKIVRRLVGAPSEEELARLRSSQEFAAYKKHMEANGGKRRTARTEPERESGVEYDAKAGRATVTLAGKSVHFANNWRVWSLVGGGLALAIAGMIVIGQTDADLIAFERATAPGISGYVTVTSRESAQAQADSINQRVGIGSALTAIGFGAVAGGVWLSIAEGSEVALRPTFNGMQLAGRF